MMIKCFTHRPGERKITDWKDKHTFLFDLISVMLSLMFIFGAALGLSVVL